MTRRPDPQQRLSQETLAQFVEVLGRTGRKDTASAAVGCSTTTTWKWANRSRLKDDDRFRMPDGEWFHEAVDGAMQCWVEADLRGALVELGTGYREPVIYQGHVCFEPDLSDPENYKVVDGLIVYPPKLDPLTGEPIPLTIRKVDAPTTRFLAERLDPSMKEKKEVDLTTGGKPIFFPAKRTTEELMAEHGAEFVDLEPQKL